MSRGKPTPYRGPFPFRNGPTCADFDSDGQLARTVGQAQVEIYHNGLSWVIRISERGGINHLMLGSDKSQLRRIWHAFDRVTRRHHSQSPVTMVGGIAFLIHEARQMRALIGRALWESQIA